MVLNITYECMHTLCKNAYGLVHARLCNSAAGSLPWKLLRTYLESCANIVQAVICHPPSCRLALTRPPLSPDAVRLRNPSKSTLAHGAVAAAVLHKHHPIIRVGAGLIQFVYGSRSHLAYGGYPSQKCVFAIFARFFCQVINWVLTTCVVQCLSWGLATKKEINQQTNKQTNKGSKPWKWR
jgi:hypothetical protein